MIQADYQPYLLEFKQPSGTSRGVLHQKLSYFIRIQDSGREGFGEVGVLQGLSCDDVPELEDQIRWTTQNIALGLEELYALNWRFPSIQFALEQAFSHLANGFEHFSSPFTSDQAPQKINGLIWMGDRDFMMDQISKRLSEGFTTLKMKVGAISWESERDLLKYIRDRFNTKELEIRVDANGAFGLDQAITVSAFLKEIGVHSIEQPLPAKAHTELQSAAQRMHIPIALDESLIGVFHKEDKIKLLDQIMPEYIILKPSFIGGWKGSEEWISLAQERGIGWWATSALESNLGLNAIAQWAYIQENPIPQGLGTGSLYTNNIPAPLHVYGGELTIRKDGESWDLSPLGFK